MKRKNALIIIGIALGVCIIATACHVAYDYYAYGQSSIIYFIGQEIW